MLLVLAKKKHSSWGLPPGSHDSCLLCSRLLSFSREDTVLLVADVQG